MENSINGTFFLEAQGNNKTVIESSLRTLIDKLKAEEKIKVRKEFFGDILEEHGNFSAIAEVELEFEDFLTYLTAAVKYAPSAIEIHAPGKLVLSAKEFLLAVGEIIKITKMFYAKYNVGFKFVPRGKGKIGLTEDEIEGFLEQNAIRAKIVVESKGKSRKKVIKDFVNTLSEDVFINKAKTKKLDSSAPFSGLIGIEAFMYEPKTLVDIAVKYTPVLIEIVEPEEIELSTLDLQDMGLDLASVFFEASHMVIFGEQ